jgi:hypothetical protein
MVVARRIKRSRATTKWALPDLNFAYFSNRPKPIFQTGQNLQIDLNAFPMSKNIQTLHDAIFGHDEKLSTLAQLQILTASHAINFGRDSNLNFP